MRCLVFWIAILVAGGCDRQERPVTTPAPKQSAALGLEIERVTPLPPDRPTHVAPTGSELVFWVQETLGGRETVFTISEGLPSATKFSNVAVLEALGQPGGTGSLQSLEVGGDGRLYYYFSGGKGRQLLAAFGYFASESGRAVILADTAALAQESRLGDSLALARGTIVRVGDVLWLWLRHADGSALLSLDVRRVGGTLRRTFERVATDGHPLRLTSMREDLAAGAGNSLVYFDRTRGQVWSIGVLGEASVLTDLADLSKETTAPCLDPQGREVVFVPEGGAIGEEAPEHPAQPAAATDFPALIILEGKQRKVIARGAMSAPPRLNLRALALQRLYRDRSGWLAYDGPTGELLRLKVVER